MKEQINKYARGIFEYEPLLARVTPETVNDVVWKNRKYSGKIRLREHLAREIKGIAYSTNNRIHICNSQFIGTDCSVEYTVDTYGIDPGDRITGFFYFVTNAGEEQVPFEFLVESGAYESELGSVRNLFHLANLAQANLDEALKIFTSDEFSEVFLKGDTAMSRLAEVLLANTDKKLALEEFLVATHKKARVNISIDTNKIYLSEVKNRLSEVIGINKDAWGSVLIRVKTDADFVILNKEVLCEEDFTGGRHEYLIEIEPSKLHAGKNYARITFETVYDKLECCICVDNASEENRRQRILTEKKDTLLLMNLYIKLRSRSINLEEWIAMSKTPVLELLTNDETNPFYNLFMSQLLIAEKKTNESKFYLDNAKDLSVSSRERNPLLYCYYLYVSTLLLRDSEYAKETARTVKEIYENECDDWRILWILLYLDVEMSKNKSLKLLRIKEQFNQGVTSPVLYLEACIILNEQPMLLRVLNDFELNALLFGCKRGIISSKLLLQATGVAVNSDLRPNLLYKLLVNLYEQTENTEVLEAICRLLIRQNKRGPKYVKWYEKGIENGLKVTLLFENYIASRDRSDTSLLPKTVLLYFGYNNELELPYKAYVYANLIKYKDVYPQVYKNYTMNMKEFVLNALMDGYADENTGIVMREYMTPDMINNANAFSASKALFTYKVLCNNKNIRNVIVAHKEIKDVIKYPVHNGVAYVQIYSEDPSICFEDTYGRIYKDTIEYDYFPVYKDDAVTRKLFEYSDDKLPLMLHFCDKQSYTGYSELENVRLYYKTSQYDGIRSEYKQVLIRQVIDFYFDSYEGDDVSDILESINEKELNEVYLAKLVEAFITHGNYDEAYRLSAEVRDDRLNAKRVLKLCDQILTKAEQSDELFVPEPRFIRLCYYAFSKGKYNDLLLRFLCMHFNGTTKEMLVLWEVAVENAVDVYSLEERTLGQMLFSSHYSKKIAQVFEHYYNNGAKERIVEAYLEYNAYNYFVREMVVEDSTFEIIEARTEAEKDMTTGCKLALLKYYSEKEYLDVAQLDLAKVLMEKLTKKGYIFEFYEKFAEKFTLPHEVIDKTIIEYHTNPQNRVMIHYILENSKDSEFSCIDMKNVYEGIFVATFVLFYGEIMEYYITEESPEGEFTTESMRVENRAVSGKQPDGRYEMINEMLACRSLHDNQSLDRQMHIYGVNNAIVDQLFLPL